jgi:protein TonB
MNEERVGIVTSLAIHAAFLLLFLTIPAANVKSYTKILYISFAQQEASPSLIHKEKKKIIGSKEETVQSISEPEAVEITQSNDEFIINDKPVTAAVQKGENLYGAKAEVSGSGKTENQDIVETSFGSVGAPAFLHREMPVYPLVARRFGKEGKVVLKLLIDKNGSLKNIEVIEPSGFGFTEAAVSAITKSSFTPAHRNGEKIASRALLAVRFILR